MVLKDALGMKIMCRHSLTPSPSPVGEGSFVSRCRGLVED